MFTCQFEQITAAMTFIKKSLGQPSEYIDVQSTKNGKLRFTGVYEGKMSSVLFEATVKTPVKLSVPTKFVDSIHAKGLTGCAVEDNVLAYKDSRNTSGAFAILEHKGFYLAMEKDNLVHSEVITKAIAIVQKILINPLPGFKEPDVYISAHKNELALYVGDNFHISYVTLELDSYQETPVSLTIPLKQFRLLSSLEKPSIYINNEHLIGVAKTAKDSRTLILPSIGNDTMLKTIIEDRKTSKYKTFGPRGEFLEALTASCKLNEVNVEFVLDGSSSHLKAVSSDFEQTIPITGKGDSATFSISSYQTRDFAKVAKHIDKPFEIQLMKDSVRISFEDEHKCALLMTRIS